MTVGGPRAGRPPRARCTRTPNPPLPRVPRTRPDATMRCSWARGESSRSGAPKSARKSEASSPNGYGRPESVSTTAGAHESRPARHTRVVGAPPVDGVDEAPARPRSARGAARRARAASPAASPRRRRDPGGPWTLRRGAQPELAAPGSFTRAASGVEQIVGRCPRPGWPRVSPVEGVELLHHGRLLATRLGAAEVRPDKVRSYSGTAAHFGTVSASTSTWNCTPEAQRADAERLHRRAGVLGQHDRAGGHLDDFGLVPLQPGQPRGEAAEHGIGHPGRRARRRRARRSRVRPSARPGRPWHRPGAGGRGTPRGRAGPGRPPTSGWPPSR